MESWKPDKYVFWWASLVLLVGTFMGLYIIFGLVAPKLLLSKLGLTDVLSNFLSKNMPFFGPFIGIHGHINHFTTMLFIIALSIGLVKFNALSRKIIIALLVLGIIVWPMAMYSFAIGGLEAVLPIMALRIL